jgi:DNA mismatch endonuclease (patch repair protein)
MMSRIRGRDTKPELVLRKSLHRMGFRYRVHVGDLPGRPDLVFPKHNALVFVHGCFWHRHSGCKQATTPSSNVSFWREKFGKTVERDAVVLANARQVGWRVAVVWECALERRGLPDAARRIGMWLMSEKRQLELPRPHHDRAKASIGPKS